MAKTSKTKRIKLKKSLKKFSRKATNLTSIKPNFKEQKSIQKRQKLLIIRIKTQSISTTFDGKPQRPVGKNIQK